LILDQSNLKAILDELVHPPLAVYSFSINSRKGLTLIELALDDFSHPTGSVTVGECERVSRLLGSILETRFPEVNFALQISSAGAERSLRLPEDLNRFHGQKVRLFYKSEEGKVLDQVFRILETKEDKVVLEIFLKKKKAGLLELDVKNITKGNLYLDF
jgi:ribosome maturation factor RimP